MARQDIATPIEVENPQAKLLNMHIVAKPPSRLYKYSAFTAQNLENLKNQIIYFSSPRGFNDPYDCSVTPTIRFPTEAEVHCVRNGYLDDPTISPTTREQLVRTTNDEMRLMIVSAAEKLTAEKVKEFSEKRGVCCFSEVCDELLMWAHYGGNYRGFCLEFDISFFPKIQKVQYSNELPTFNPISVLNTELGTEDFMSVFSSKSLSWAYEKEWRAFHADVGTSYCYPSEALTGVYFGPEISSAALEIICLILQGQNET